MYHPHHHRGAAVMANSVDGINHSSPQQPCHGPNNHVPFLVSADFPPQRFNVTISAIRNMNGSTIATNEPLLNSSQCLDPLLAVMSRDASLRNIQLLLMGQSSNRLQQVPQLTASTFVAPHLGCRNAVLMLQRQMERSQLPTFLRHKGNPIPGIGDVGLLPNQGINGRMAICFPVTLTDSLDEVKLSPIQCLLRQQIEVFEATADEATTHVRGRNKPVRLKQVGIRCRHCASMLAWQRPKGSTYFPTSVWGFYQASQNMLAVHMCSGVCTSMPSSIQEQFVSLRQKQHPSSSQHCPPSGAGRAYWAQTAQKLGFVDMRDGVYCNNDIPVDVSPPETQNESILESSGVYRRVATNRMKRQRIV